MAENRIIKYILPSKKLNEVLIPVVYYSKDGLHPIERLRIEMMGY